jgi:hypothetical protein
VRAAVSGDNGGWFSAWNSASRGLPKTAITGRFLKPWSASGARVSVCRIVQPPEPLDDVVEDFASIRMTGCPRVGEDQTFCRMGRNFVKSRYGGQRADDGRLECNQQCVADWGNVNEAEVSYGVGYDIDIIRIGIESLLKLRGRGWPGLSRIIEDDACGFESGACSLQFLALL